ncbi:hypothetical protein SteCoe_3605 [Stentor coeruleus]|uniref:Uncharacterized protein n=1 Tax=Stentor coeruleus TaxID=5963 RepID=A0A1R2CWV9_9CILI|nr:hypothetical protein SteCoe_3605 [Stentor coeruleus]
MFNSRLQEKQVMANSPERCGDLLNPKIMFQIADRGREEKDYKKINDESSHSVIFCNPSNDSEFSKNKKTGIRFMRDEEGRDISVKNSQREKFISGESENSQVLKHYKKHSVEIHSENPYHAGRSEKEYILENRCSSQDSKYSYFPNDYKLQIDDTAFNSQSRGSATEFYKRPYDFNQQSKLQFEDEIYKPSSLNLKGKLSPSKDRSSSGERNKIESSPKKQTRCSDLYKSFNTNETCNLKEEYYKLELYTEELEEQLNKIKTENKKYKLQLEKHQKSSSSANVYDNKGDVFTKYDSDSSPEKLNKKLKDQNSKLKKDYEDSLEEKKKSIENLQNLNRELKWNYSKLETKYKQTAENIHKLKRIIKEAEGKAYSIFRIFASNPEYHSSRRSSPEYPSPVKLSFSSEKSYQDLSSYRNIVSSSNFELCKMLEFVSENTNQLLQDYENLKNNILNNENKFAERKSSERIYIQEFEKEKKDLEMYSHELEAEIEKLKSLKNVDKVLDTSSLSLKDKEIRKLFREKAFLSAKVEELEKDIEGFKNKHKPNHNIDVLNKLSIKLSKEIEDLQKENRELLSFIIQLRQAVSEKEIENEAQQILIIEQQDMIANFKNKETTVNQEIVQKTVENINKDIENIKVKHETELQVIVLRHDEKLENLTEMYKEKLSNAEKEIKSYLENIEYLNREIEILKGQQENELEKLKEYHQSEKSIIEDKANEHITSLIKEIEQIHIETKPQLDKLELSLKLSENKCKGLTSIIEKSYMKSCGIMKEIGKIHEIKNQLMKNTVQEIQSQKEFIEKSFKIFSVDFGKLTCNYKKEINDLINEILCLKKHNEYYCENEKELVEKIIYLEKQCDEQKKYYCENENEFVEKIILLESQYEEQIKKNEYYFDNEKELMEKINFLEIRYEEQKKHNDYYCENQIELVEKIKFLERQCEENKKYYEIYCENEKELVEKIKCLERQCEELNDEINLLKSSNMRKILEIMPSENLCIPSEKRKTLSMSTQDLTLILQDIEKSLEEKSYDTEKVTEDIIQDYNKMKEYKENLINSQFENIELHQVMNIIKDTSQKEYELIRKELLDTKAKNKLIEERFQSTYLNLQNSIKDYEALHKELLDTKYKNQLLEENYQNACLNIQSVNKEYELLIKKLLEAEDKNRQIEESHQNTYLSLNKELLKAEEKNKQIEESYQNAYLSLNKEREVLKNEILEAKANYELIEENYKITCLNLKNANKELFDAECKCKLVEERYQNICLSLQNANEKVEQLKNSHENMQAKLKETISELELNYFKMTESYSDKDRELDQFKQNYEVIIKENNQMKLLTQQEIQEKTLKITKLSSEYEMLDKQNQDKIKTISNLTEMHRKIELSKKEITDKLNQEINSLNSKLQEKNDEITNLHHTIEFIKNKGTAETAKLLSELSDANTLNDNLKKQCQEIENNKNLVVKKHTIIEKELNDNKNKLKISEDTITSQNQKIETLENDIYRFLSEEEKLKQMVSELQGDVEAKKMQLVLLQREANELVEQNSKLEDKNQDLKKSHEKELRALEDEYKKLKEQNQILDSKGKNFTKETQKHEGEIEKLKKQNKGYEKKNKTLQQETQTLKTEIEKLQNDIKTNEANSKSLQQEIRNLEIERKKHQEIVVESKKLSQQLHAQNKEIESLKKKIAESDAAYKALYGKLQTLESQTKDNSELRKQVKQLENSNSNSRQQTLTTNQSNPNLTSEKAELAKALEASMVLQKGLEKANKKLSDKSQELAKKKEECKYMQGNTLETSIIQEDADLPSSEIIGDLEYKVSDLMENLRLANENNSKIVLENIELNEKLGKVFEEIEEIKLQKFNEYTRQEEEIKRLSDQIELLEKENKGVIEQISIIALELEKSIDQDQTQEIKREKIEEIIGICKKLTIENEQLSNVMKNLKIR